MTRPVIKIALLIATLMTGGCTLELTCDLYNNTGLVLIVTIFPSAEKNKELKVAPRASVRLPKCDLSQYRVMADGKAWKYDSIQPPEEFIKTVGVGPWSQRIFQGQLEPDGKVFAILPNVQVPTRLLNKQPDGFPITPT